MNIFIIVIIRRLSFMVINCRINPPPLSLSLKFNQSFIHLPICICILLNAFQWLAHFAYFKKKKISAERKGKGNIGALTPSTLKKPLYMVAHFRIMKVSSNKTGYILGKYTEWMRIIGLENIIRINVVILLIIGE